MLGLISLAIIGLVALFFIKYYLALQRNINAAKESGIRYVVSPFHAFNPIMIFFHRRIIPLLRKLPSSWQKDSWVEVLSPMHGWFHLRWTSDELGADTYLTVSPGGIILWTSGADVISQITNRRADFPKPIEVYQNIDIFGKNVVTGEGQFWRHHRKIVSPPFTEKNNHLVWTESIHQAQSMMKSWTGMDGNQSRTIRTAPHDTMLLSLHVISRAGFGQRLLWPGVETDETEGPGAAGKGTPNSANIRPGHKLAFTDALSGLLENLVMIVAGGNLLQYLPSKKANFAHLAWIEWGKYMNEMLQDKQDEVNSGYDSVGLDILGSMVRSAAGDGNGSKPLLSDSEILGNAFIFILAGHETTANTIHFSCIYLACYPEVQRRLQADIESIFQGRKPEDWDYDKDLPKLFGSLVGATMNEELRLIPPVIGIPKSTESIQPLIVDGKRCTVPANTLINLTTSSAHRNPKYWPHGPPSDPGRPVHPKSNLDNDLEEFKPERWILTEEQKQAAKSEYAPRARPAKGNEEDEEQDATGGPTADTAASLFKPVRGSYLPFSDGPRSCLGKRFAQVEILAVLAVIFNEWSVELSLDDFATEEEVKRMSDSERQETWQKAKDRALWVFRERMEMLITLKMIGDNHTPLRFVRKGKERF